MARVVGLLLFGLLLACGSKGSEPALDPKATEGFARALAAVAGADPTQSAALLAQGAFETVAPSMMCFKGFAGAATEQARIEALFDCGLACTAEAVQKLKGTEPRTWMAGLAAACPPEHFGIDPAQAALLSSEWFLVYKIGELAAPHAKAARGGKARLDQAMAGFQLPLPMPAVAAGLYELAVAPPAASVPVATRTYVIAMASGALRVGAAPHATLGGAGAGIATAEGRAPFPGNEVARADLRATLLETAGVEKTAAAPPVDAAPPPAAASEPPGLRGDVNQTLRGDHGRDGEPVPLLLADGALPAAQLVAIAGELPRVLVAVAAPDDPAARALAVELEMVRDSAGRSPGQAHIDLAPGTLDAALKAAGGTEEIVVIRVDGQVQWKDAAAVAGAVIARGGKRLILTIPELDGPSGMGTGLLGHGASDQGPRAIFVVSGGGVTATSPDADVIGRVMRRRMHAMRACYERELAINPGLAGRVDLEFNIGRDGAVTKAKGSGLGTVAECAARVVRVLKFPPPKFGATILVRYPLIFEPRDE